MLLQFSVTNHRSIKDTAIISLKASTDKSLSDCLISPDEKKQLVPVLALYGANAAGKSNVLHALLLMREMVCGRYAKLLKGEALPQEPFAFTEQPPRPTSFEVIYFYNGIKYAYGFSFDKAKILTEYLYHWPNGREALIFSREGNGYQFRENIQEQFTLAGRTAENRLYLSSSNEWNCPQTEKAYLWFFEKLTGFMGTEMRLDATLSAIRQGGSEKSRILHEMLYADLGIKDIRITGSKEEPIISALHTLDAEDGTSKGFWLPLGQESVGTQRFFSRIGMWLAALESGSVLVVDEIESSMHPLLTRHLIEMVQDAAINTNHAQLIFTTHDTGLLDLTLLRRDQIWFAEKDEKTMQTDIYALTEFSPRKGENISKGYLQGRYGAIPFIGGCSMGRIKEISRKSAHTRKRNPVVYLICEGSETEIRYFKRFRSRGCNIDIIPISSQYKSADRLVQKAKATMGNNPYYPEDGDSIWCVFDRDDNSNEVLLRAKQSAQKEGYHLAYSNPSFELWFLLHFVNQQAEVEDCQALIRLLKQTSRISDYEKNKDYFDVLKPLQATAIQRAKARADQVQKQGLEPISRQSNPLTTIWELVEYLNSKV